MPNCRALVVLFASSMCCSLICGAATPGSDPQALKLAAQSIAVLTVRNSISDVTLTGTVTWTSGPDSETGTATLQALGSGESRMDLALTSGMRTEIRDSQTGTPVGKWVNPDTHSGTFVFQNCQTDAVWFFPALSSLKVPANIVLSYIGQTTWNGHSAQHIQSYLYQPNAPSVVPSTQQLSTLDFYLDATTLLPIAVTFNAHPDNDAATSLLVEVDFSNYQAMSGAMVPAHIQRYQEGTLMVDLTVTGAAFNTGLSLSAFAVD